MKTHVVTSAANSLSADLLRVLVDEVRTLQEPWTKIPEGQQQQLINRLRDSVQKASSRAVKAIAAVDFVRFDAKLLQITIKDGVKATLAIGAGVEHLAILAEDVGANVLLVLAEPDRFQAGIDEIRADPDQQELAIGETHPEGGVDIEAPDASGIEFEGPAAPIVLEDDIGKLRVVGKSDTRVEYEGYYRDREEAYGTLSKFLNEDWPGEQYRSVGVVTDPATTNGLWRVLASHLIDDTQPEKSEDETAEAGADSEL